MKIRFSEDKYYNGELKYKKGKIHEISEKNGEADRWLKRGGEEITDEGLDDEESEKSSKNKNKRNQKPKEENLDNNSDDVDSL